MRNVPVDDRQGKMRVSQIASGWQRQMARLPAQTNNGVNRIFNQTAGGETIVRAPALHSRAGGHRLVPPLGMERYSLVGAPACRPARRTRNDYKRSRRRRRQKNSIKSNLRRHHKHPGMVPPLFPLLYNPPEKINSAKKFHPAAP